MATDCDVVFGSTDLFGFGDNFDPISSSEKRTQEYAESLDFQGDLSKACPFNEQIEMQATYNHVGTDLIADLAAANIRLGKVSGQGVILSIQLTFANNAVPQLQVTGHQHGTTFGGNIHNDDACLASWELDLATIIDNIPSCMGVPTGGAFANSEVKSVITQLSLAYSCDHQDEMNHEGQQFIGNNSNGRVTASATFLGTPILNVPATWYVTEVPLNADRTNTGFATSSLSAYRVLPRYVAP